MYHFIIKEDLQINIKINSCTQWSNIRIDFKYVLKKMNSRDKEKFLSIEFFNRHLSSVFNMLSVFKNLESFFMAFRTPSGDQENL